jgi:hypothetical protein
VYQELDPHGLPRKRCHVYLRIDKPVCIVTHVEDRLQDSAGSIRDVSILPVERNGVGGAILMPEAQRALTRGDGELLIE